MSLLKNFIYTSVLLFVVIFPKSILADIQLHNYVDSFVKNYTELHHKSTQSNKRFILKYELVDHKKIAKIFYDGHPMPRDRRSMADLEKYARKLPTLVPTYNQKVVEIKEIIPEIDTRIHDLFGVKVNASVFLFSSLSQTDAVTMGTDATTRPTVAINLKEVSAYSKDDLKILLAHELFHVVQHQVAKGTSNEGMIDGNLFNEGWATYASSLIVPGHPDWKYISYFNKDNHQYLRFQKEKRIVIKSLLKDWNSNSEEKMDKYFSGDTQVSYPFEPRSGYYIGYLAAKKMAEHGSPIQVALLQYNEFKKQIKPILKQLG